MEVQHVLRMTGGEGETSYAFNSSLQRTVMGRVKPIIEETISDLCRSTFLECLSIADLGCSSGPNTLLVISHILDTTNRACHRLNRLSPEFQVFLNDLPGNDFNSIFKSLPAFYEKLKREKGENFGPCFITAMPGSFYGRLFPNKTIHFIHSSYSLHFLSQVPKGLESEDGIPLNKGNIYLGRTSPVSVFKAYREQFQKDFSKFLKLRSEEIIAGGRAVLTFMGRRTDDPSCDENCTPWTLLALALNDMVSEGLVEAAKVDSFNIPYYAASAREVKFLIEAEGSFNLDRLEVFELSWDDGSMVNSDNINDVCVFDKFTSRAKHVSNLLKAAAESMLEWHFGKALIDDLFYRFTAKVAQLWTQEEPKCFNLVVSLTKN